MKHAAGAIAVHRQAGGAGAEDGDFVADHQFAAGQHNGAGDAGCVNGVAVDGDGQRVAQRTTTIVSGSGDEDGRREPGCCCGAQQRRAQDVEATME